MRLFGAILAAAILLGGALLLMHEEEPRTVFPEAAAEIPRGPEDASQERTAAEGPRPVDSREDVRAPAGGSPPVAQSAGDGSGAPVLVGRVLEVGGTPLERAWFSAWLQRGTEQFARTMVGTDGAGRFEYRLDERVPLPLAGASFEALRWTDGLLDRRARVALPRLVAGTRCDVGDLLLRPFAGWVRGSLTGPDGEPILDARVFAKDAGGADLDRARVDEDGSFAFEFCWIQSSLEEGVRLEARADGWFQREPVIVHELGSEVRIVLERGGRIEGSLVFDPLRMPPELSVLARREGADSERRFGTIEEDGRFAIDGLDTARYAFDLAAGWQGMPTAPLVTIPGIAVRRGETTLDPRLANLDLAVLVHTVELRVVDRQGQPVRGAQVSVFTAEGELLSFTHGDSIRLALPPDRSVDVLVAHRDYRLARVSNLTDDATVVLEDGIHVFLSAARPMPLDLGPRGAFLRLLPEPEGGESWPGLGVDLTPAFGDGREVEAVFPQPGLYRLHVLERMGSSFGIRPGDRYLPLEVTFDVLEEDAGTHRPLDLPPDLFELAERARAEPPRQR